MNQPNALQKPTRLEQAQARLASALANLEDIVAVGGAPCGAADVARESQALQSENAALKRRNDTLSALNDRIVTRLDAIIARLKTSAEA